MKSEQQFYRKGMEDARFMSDIFSKLEIAKELDQGNHLSREGLLDNYEQRQLIEVKDAIARIWCQFDLENVTGHLDFIFETKEKKKGEKELATV